MDGTLLDTLEDITAALNQALQNNGYPAHTNAQVATYIGSGSLQLIERALPKHTPAGEVLRIRAAYQQAYDQSQDLSTRPFPGILPMLTALEEAGVKLGIISNKGTANVKQLAKAHFGNLFHAVFGAQEDVPIKPAPDMLLAAMRKLQTEPEKTLYIGDAPVDFEAAQNAGTDCILVRWGYGDEKALNTLSPLFFASDPAELPMLILKQS